MKMEEEHLPCGNWNNKAIIILVEKRIRPADLSASKKHVPLLDGKAWVFRLDEPKADVDTDKLKEHFFSHRPGKKK